MEDGMKEIRIHGRGGQGAVTAVRILAAAFVHEGKWASGFPSFGMERRGAPVMAFARFDDKPIWEKTKVYRPDCIVVIDSRLISSKSLTEGIKPNSILVLNTAEKVKEQMHENIGVIGYVDATRIGLEEVGIAVTNTCMIGAFARTTEWVQLPSLLACLGEFFSGDMLEKNRRCVERGFDETKCVRF
jgi:2-oxoacid:acceptor oxidoreductase gamma subunit (pyruvate/2-ketoisovalerate family)